jgi:hypothetical protein
MRKMVNLCDFAGFPLSFLPQKMSAAEKRPVIAV